MRRLSFFFFSFLFSISLFAQKRDYEVTLWIHQLEDSIVYVKGAYGQQSSIILDTLHLKKDGEFLRCVIMIITREEMYQTEIFDIFYDGVFKPSGEMMFKLVEIASNGRYSGESAMIVSEMIMGQVHMFNSARAGFKRMNKWKTFGEREISIVGENFSAMLERIFA